MVPLEKGLYRCQEVRDEDTPKGVLTFCVASEGIKELVRFTQVKVFLAFSFRNILHRDKKVTVSRSDHVCNFCNLAI